MPKNSLVAASAVAVIGSVGWFIATDQACII
jgi:hypothetical protein